MGAHQVCTYWPLKSANRCLCIFGICSMILTWLLEIRVVAIFHKPFFAFNMGNMTSREAHSVCNQKLYRFVIKKCVTKIFLGSFLCEASLRGCGGSNPGFDNNN